MNMRDELVEGFLLILANHAYSAPDYDYDTGESGCACGWTEPVETETGYDRHLAEVLADAGATVNVKRINPAFDAATLEPNNLAAVQDWLRNKATATSANPRWWSSLLHGGLSITCNTYRAGVFRAEVGDVIQILPEDGGVAVYTLDAWKAWHSERRRANLTSLTEIIEWVENEAPGTTARGEMLLRLNGVEMKSGDLVVRLGYGDFTVMTHAQEQRFARAGRHEFGEQK